KVKSPSIRFEELEALLTMAVMDGPLESTPSNAADVPEDPAFVNFFSITMTVGNSSNVAICVQPYQSNTTTYVPSHPASVSSHIVPTLQIPSPPLSAPTPLMPPIDTSESGKLTPNLPVSSSTPTASPLNPPLSLQWPNGGPVLQTFPPPTPPPSLTPAFTSNNGPFISKKKV
ncbi:hypothetical protein CISIN_1g047258mg, partial [Citrus sinensis]